MDKIKEMKKLNSQYKRLPALIKGWSLSTRFVPGEGPLNAKVMLIGQAPGRMEDELLRPFIGTSGKFLDMLISMAGLERKSVYICSVVQFFPPKNRIPTDEEVEVCNKFLFRQIDIIDPKLVILLGSLAVKTLLNMDKISKIHGSLIEKGGRTYFASLHPAAAVRIRTKMPLMEEDFKRLNGKIKRFSL